MNKLENNFTHLRLHGMKRSYEALVESRKHHQLSLPEGLEILLQAEIEDKKNRKFDRLRKNAKFRYQASLDEVLIKDSRGLSKSLMAQLATGEYIRKGEAVLITGATGCGKSFIASALGHQACLLGFRVAYFNIQKLLTKIKIARAEGTHVKLFKNISRTDLLILDDFGLSTLSHQQRLDLMEIIEDRHSSKATIISSQLPVENWYETIGENTIADAIMDRLVHTSHRIKLSSILKESKLS